MKTNRANAPLTYAEDRRNHPDDTEKRDAWGRHRKFKPAGRGYICAHCRQAGGTLKNIGTHKEPYYVHHPPCAAMKALEKKAGGGKA